ncbi:MAG: cobalamin-independent methionine synthase II family protein [Sneathiellaceae bacterium]
MDITHVGSLPRGRDLADLLILREKREAYDEAALQAAIAERVAHVVARQVAAGVTVANDGEQSRAGFQTYIVERMSGFGGESTRRPPLDYSEFPSFAALMASRMRNVAKVRNAPMAQAPVRYTSTDAVTAECDRLTAALPGTVAGFMTAPSPGIVATTLDNAHYDSDEAYLAALADELAKEYRAILDAGLVLQIDAPDLAMERCIKFQDLTDEGFVEQADRHVAALNRALAGLPKERIRLHCCWGNWDGPHLHDLALAKILPVLYRAEVGQLSIPFANPRHQHEYRAFEAHPFPSDRVLLPGVVDTTCNYVEHPEVIRARIGQAVAVTGDAARVIPCTDCGFGTFAGFDFVAEEVVWEKLKTIRDGVALYEQQG